MTYFALGWRRTKSINVLTWIGSVIFFPWDGSNEQSVPQDRAQLPSCKWSGFSVEIWHGHHYIQSVVNEHKREEAKKKKSEKGMKKVYAPSDLVVWSIKKMELIKNMKGTYKHKYLSIPMYLS